MLVLKFFNSKMPAKTPVKIAPNVEYSSSSKEPPDFILVFDNTTITNEQFDIATRFLAELSTVGIKHDTEPFSVNKDLDFVKLRAPDQVLYKSAEQYNIDLTCHTSPEFKPPCEKPTWKFMRNELNAPERDGVVYRRAPYLLNVQKPEAITSAERILVLYTILNNTRFGEGEHDVGFEKLLKNKTIKDGFPLHDGTHHWSDGMEPLNERQLLTKYWSKLSCMAKEQPLDVINHYFGTSAAFYFAWMSFYNKMLLPMGIGGLVLFLLGLLVFSSPHKEVADEICHSDMVICPRCLTHKHCAYGKVSNSCFSAKYSYAFDNPMTFIFAILMSCWAVIFLRMWYRRERILQMRWNVRNLEVDSSFRFGFKEKTKLKMKSPITGEEEPYISKTQQVACHFLSLFIMFAMVCINAFVIIMLMMWSHHLITVIVKHTSSDFVERNARTLSSTAAAIVALIFIVIFGSIYCKVALELTNLENPRTQMDFENSYVYKLYILAFVNNYTSLFYAAFFKGKFYTHPGDRSIYEKYFGTGTDSCDTFGCIWDFGIIMLTNMLFKKTALIRYAKYWIKRHVVRKIVARFGVFGGIMGILKPVEYDKTKQWEKEYLLMHDTNLDLLNEYLEMAIQYGLVTFFVACFPLAPLLAWINNIFEVRLRARKRTVEKRRIVPVKVMGLGAWHIVFQAVTLIGFITNALIIAFTSDFIPKEVYRNQKKSLEGYVNFSLSVFDTNDFIKDFVDLHFDYKAEPYCYYAGQRLNPGHPNQYQPTGVYWYLLTIKVIFVVVFVHALFLLSTLVSYYIPTTPFAVKQLINIQEDYLKGLKLNTKHKVGGPARSAT